MKLLNSTREKAIQKMIIDKSPEQLKLDFALWTRKAVKKLIEQQYSIDIAIITVGTYLKTGDLRLKNPRKKPMNKMTKRFKNGWKKNILRYKNWQKSKTQKFIGVMNVMLKTNVNTVEAMLRKGKRQ